MSIPSLYSVSMASSPFCCGPLLLLGLTQFRGRRRKRCFVEQQPVARGQAGRAGADPEEHRNIHIVIDHHPGYLPSGLDSTITWYMYGYDMVQ